MLVSCSNGGLLLRPGLWCLLNTPHAWGGSSSACLHWLLQITPVNLVFIKLCHVAPRGLMWRQRTRKVTSESPLRRKGLACQGDSVEGVKLKWSDKVYTRSSVIHSAGLFHHRTMLNCKCMPRWDDHRSCLLVHIFDFSTYCRKVEQNIKCTLVPTEYTSYRGLFKYFRLVASSLKCTTLSSPIIHAPACLNLQIILLCFIILAVNWGN